MRRFFYAGVGVVDDLVLQFKKRVQRFIIFLRDRHKPGGYEFTHVFIFSLLSHLEPLFPQDKIFPSRFLNGTEKSFPLFKSQKRLESGLHLRRSRRVIFNIVENLLS
ncbi:hypothetical protein D3C78_871450 [compost metagenome]